MRTFTCSLALLLVGLVLPGPASAADEACSCQFDPTTIWSLVDESDAVFAGESTERRRVGVDAEAWTVDVVSVYEGAPGAFLELLVEDPADQSADDFCAEGIHGLRDEAAVFFARVRRGELVVDSCDPLLSVEKFEELVTPIAPPTGSGDAWAVALGTQDDANIQVLDGSGRMLSSTRIDGNPRRGVACGSTEKIALVVDAHDDRTSSLVILDIADMTEISRTGFDAETTSFPVRVLGCTDDGIALVKYSRPDRPSDVIGWVGPAASRRSLEFDSSESWASVVWPYLVVTPKAEVGGPVEVTDVRFDGAPISIDISDGRYVTMFGLVPDTAGPSEMLWLLDVETEVNGRSPDLVRTIDLATIPAVELPTRELDGPGSDSDRLERMRLIIDDDPPGSGPEAVRWVHSDGSDYSTYQNPRTNHAVDGRTGTILATSRGVALLDDDGVATLLGTDPESLGIFHLIELAASGTEVESIAPTPSEPRFVGETESGVQFTVDRPTTLEPRSLSVVPPPLGPAAVALFVIVVFAGGAVLMMRRRRLSV